MVSEQRQMVTELISHDIIFKVTVSAKGSMIEFGCAPVCCLIKPLSENTVCVLPTQQKLKSRKLYCKNAWVCKYAMLWREKQDRLLIGTSYTDT